jgi:xylulokinase
MMLLGLDVGTGSLKALLIEADGTVMGEGSSTYPTNAPHPGWVETNPMEWWRAAQEATLEAVGSRGAEVMAIGLSGQMHGVVLTGHHGEPLRDAMLWADARSSKELEVFRRLKPDRLRRLGNPLAVGMTGVSLLWLQQHEPDVLNQASWVLQAKDWLRFKLTGIAQSEPSDASGTLLYDLERDEWFFDLVADLGLPADLLAPIVPSGSVAGHLRPEAAEHLGLRAGIAVAAGGADAACALLGSGLLEPGLVQLTIGTAAQIVAPKDQPRIDPRLQTHLYRAVAPNRWYAMAAMQNAGIALEKVRGWLGLSWLDAYVEAFNVPAGSEGLTFLPYLTGERTPHLDPHVRGQWAGLGLHHTRGHLMRSALEGVAFCLKDGLAALEATGVNAPELRLAGGGTLHPRWRQLLADVLERSLLATDVPDASARGAALLAGVASGVFTDAQATLAFAPTPVPVAEPASSDTYHDAYTRFRSLYPRVKGWGLV